MVANRPRIVPFGKSTKGSASYRSGFIKEIIVKKPLTSAKEQKYASRDRSMLKCTNAILEIIELTQ